MLTALGDQIKQHAIELGAGLVGIAPVEAYPEYAAEVSSRLTETGASHADYMLPAGDTAFFDRLSSGRSALPSAAAVIVIGVYVYDERAAYRDPRRERRGKIARTYRYYPVVRQVAEGVASRIRELGYAAVHGQDVPLKYVAARIGLGAYGKHGLLLTERYGSYVALRDVITDASLAPDHFPSPSFCEGCDRCLRACPTGALYAPYKVNPRLCINPITRREGPIAPELAAKMRNWIHGCDICQEACPVNRRLQPRAPDPRAGFDPAHHASHQHLGGLEPQPRLRDLLDGDYPHLIQRNAAIALANLEAHSTRSRR